MDTALENQTGIHFTLNGKSVTSRAAGTARLSDVLREELACRDVKVGCNAGDCGACTVLLDGEAVCACLTGVGQVADRELHTLAGLIHSDSVTQQLTESFLKHNAAQCGICTPGFLVTAAGLFKTSQTPDEAQILDALGGVLCRCTGYRKIIDAVLEVAKAASVGGVEGAGDSTNTGYSDTAPKADRTPKDSAAQPTIASVGQPLRRIDGLRKVTGEELFADDVAPAGALVLRVVRSPHHHARFHIGDIQAFIQQHPGVERVLTVNDVPALNRFGIIPPYIDQPVFAESSARFKGEAVAAIVGEAAAIAKLNLDKFPVSWHPEHPLLTAAEALSENAAPLGGNATDNILCRGHVQQGDPVKALKTAHVVAEGQFSTGFVEHAYIEPEAGYARRVNDTLEIHGCTQAAYMNRDSLAAIMGLELDSVRIVPTPAGGGFGSKLDLSWQPFVALAAWVTSRPVRITYTRQESMQSTTKRHPADLHVRIGADADGQLCGMEFDGDFNTGAYASWGPTVANRVPVHASGPYRVPNYRATALGVHTHCAPAGAFRGFGVPQSAIAQEALFDELADKLGMDRLEFRQKNALKDGTPTVTGQIFESGVGIAECLEKLKRPWIQALEVADAINAERKASGSPLRRGVGIASGWYGCGNTSLPNPSTIKAGVRADGSVWLHQGAIDIGQGSNTVIAQIFADALGVPFDKVNLVSADTGITPDAGKTSASRQTFVSGNAARLAGEALRAEIQRVTNQPLDGEIQHLANLPVSASGYVLEGTGTYDPPTQALDEQGQGVPYAQFGYAAQMVELDVDLRLGCVALIRFVAAHDVGKAINPAMVEGQIQGGIAQGVGLALMEEFIPGRTENLHDYLIPTIGDIPPIESIIVEVADPHGPYGAKGLGEHALIPTAPCILNAIRHASGACIRRLPATPDRVLSAIREREALDAAESSCESGSC